MAMYLMRKMGAFGFMTMVFTAMIASTIIVSSASVEYPDLLKLTSANEDVRMNAQDLAFLLVTHNFDATPKGDHVDVKINGSIYRMTPNGVKAGLADIVLAQLFAA